MQQYAKCRYCGNPIVRTAGTAESWSHTEYHPAVPAYGTLQVEQMTAAPGETR